MEIRRKINFLYKIANREVSIIPLISFRVLFGFMMLFTIIRFWVNGWIKNHFVDPIFHFTFYGFEWIKPLPETGMYIIYFILLLSTINIILGFYYRISIFIFFLLFTYTELIDVTYYLNHYYFISIVSFIMIFLPAHRYYSLDIILKNIKPTANSKGWTIDIIKILLGLVYFYAGIAKINFDWLFNALPLQIWLPSKSDLPLIGNLLTKKYAAYIFSWGGMLFDISVPFLLLIRRTRFTAWIIICIFHFITGLLFQIGVFPWIMTLSTLIFFESSTHYKFWERVDFIFPKFKLKTTNYTNNNLPKYAFYSLLFFISFQIIFPFRFLFFPGNLYWTEQGYRFSWRVMLIEKAGTIYFYVQNSKNDKEYLIENCKYLNRHQEKQMAFQPDMILQFAHFLKREFQKKGFQNIKIRCESYVTLNGRPSRLFINPNIDLTKINNSFFNKNWILP